MKAHFEFIPNILKSAHGSLLVIGEQVYSVQICLI